MGARSPGSSQSGFTLIEAVVAAAILAVVALGTAAAFSGIATVNVPNPSRDAAELEMRRLLTLAQAATKYSDPQTVSINSTPWTTTMPNPNGSPIPLRVTASKSPLPNGRYSLTISIGYVANGAAATLTKSMLLVQKAPAPNALLTAPGLYPDPAATATP